MIICEQCHYKLPEKSTFCGRCGRRIKLPGEDSLNARTYPSADRQAVSHTPDSSQKATQPLPGQVSSTQHILETQKAEEFEHELLNPFEPDEFAEKPPIPDQTNKPVQDEDDDDDDEAVVFPFPFQSGSVPQVQMSLYADTIPSAPPPQMPFSPPQPTLPIPPPQMTPAPPQLTLPVFPPSSPIASPVSLPAVSMPPTPSPRLPALHLRMPKPPKLNSMRPTCLITSLIIFISICLVILIFNIFRPSAPVSPVANVLGRPDPGQTIMLQGTDFPKGETLIITVDTPYKIASSGNTQSLMVSGLLMESQAKQHTSSVAHWSVSVGEDGVFTFPYVVNSTWSVGSQHTFYIYDHNGQLLKQVPFEVTSTSSQRGLVDCPNLTNPVNMGSLNEGVEQPVSKTVPICTEGSGTIDWRVNWDVSQSWFHSSSPSPLSAPNSGSLTLYASAHGLKPGAYTVAVTLSSKQSTRKIVLNVVFTILKQHTSTQSVPLQSHTPTDCVSVAPRSLSFTAVTQQSAAVQQVVQVNNCGDQGGWSSTTSTKDGTSWLSTDVAGNVLSPGNMQYVYVKASALHRQPGTYTGQVTFRIRGSVVVIPVTFQVLNSSPSVYCLTNDKQSLTFYSTVKAGDPKLQKLTLINCGASGHWSSTPTTDDGTNWLQVAARSNDLPQGGTQAIEISVSSIQLHEGRYTGKITFALGSSLTHVNITFIVQKPCIKVLSEPLVFKSTKGESDPASQRVTIYNCGADGYWYAAPLAGIGDWLHLDEDHGWLRSGEKHTVTVSVSNSKLQEGNYAGAIMFAIGSSGSSDITLAPVTFIIKPPSPPPVCLQVSPQDLTFTVKQGQGDPEPQTLTLFNCGKKTGTWSAQAPPWLRIIAPENKTLPSDHLQSIQVVPSTEGLDVRSHSGTITFYMDSKPLVKVAITLDIKKRSHACIQLDTSALAFDTSSISSSSTQLSDLQAQTVKITNCGDTGILHAKLNGNGEDWLHFALTGNDKTLPAGESTVASFTVDLSRLNDYGSYRSGVTFTLTVDDDTSNSEPVQVELRYIRLSAPQPCTVDPPSLTFTSSWGTLPSDSSVSLKNCGAHATWTASDNSGRVLYVSPGEGTLDDAGEGTANVKILGNPYSGDHHSYTLTFTTSQGASVRVPVTWDVQIPDNPCIEADSAPAPITLTKGERFHTMIEFTNCGVNPGTIWINGSSWLNMGCQNGSIDGSSSYLTGSGPRINVDTDTTNLEPREYSGTISATIRTQQGSYDMTVPIILDVVSPSVPPPPPDPGPTETPVPTPIETPTPTPVPTDTPTPTPMSTPTPTPTSVPTVTPTPTSVPTVTPTPVPQPTPTSVVQPTPTSVVQPTPTSVVQPTPTPVPQPTPTPVPQPTPTSVVQPTPTPVVQPTPTPVPQPTPTPTLAPQPTPTPIPPQPTPTPIPPEPTPTPIPAEPTPTPIPAEPTPTPIPAEPTPTPIPAEPTPTPIPEEPTPTPIPEGTSTP